MTEIVAAHLERVARNLAERVDKLMDAADHLVWATEIEIQGGPRTRSFILQHRAKCRYNVEQTKKAMAALTGEQNAVAAALAACAREATVQGRNQGIAHCLQIVQNSRSTDEHANWLLKKLADTMGEALERAAGEKA